MSCNLYRISGLHYTSLRVNRSMMILKKSILLLFICGVFGDEEKKVSVMEGESVTLNSNLTDIQNYWLISWKFEDNVIAEISYSKMSHKDGPDGRFRDRLQLNSKTGSLTVTNMRMKHSGLYKLEAASSSTTIGTKYKTFSVSVYESPSAITVVEAEMKSVSVKEGDPLTLQTDVLQPRDELIVWRFGNEEKLIAKADLEANNNSYINTDERFKDRLKLDETGSLTITSFKYTDSGLYLVKISSSKQTLHKKFSVTVSDPGLSSGAKAGIVVVVLLVILAAGVLYRCCNQKRKMSKISKELSGIAKELLKIADELKKLLENSKVFEVKICGQLSEISEGLSKISEKDLSEENEEKLSEICNQLKKLLTDSEQLKKMLEISGGLSEDSEQLKKLLDGKISEKLTKISKEDLPRISGKLNQLPKISGKLNQLWRAPRKVPALSPVRVSVKEGEPAHLETGVENLQNVKIFWCEDQKSPLAEIKEGADPIIYDNVFYGRFKGRLHLDEKTGSLSINNTNTGDSGEYRICFKSNTNKNTLLKFTVSVSAEKNEELEELLTVQSEKPDQSLTVQSKKPAQSVPIYESSNELLEIVQASIGHFVTLKNETKIQTGDQFTWLFGDDNSPIAEIKIITYDDILDGKFKDRLNLDKNTGYLTIKNIRKEDAGLYKLKIVSSSSKKITNKKFCVYTEAVRVSVKEGEPAHLETGVKNLQNVPIRWMCENNLLIVKLTGKSEAITYENVLNGRFQGRLDLDEKTGTLSIRDTNTGDSGQYSFWFTGSENHDTFLMFTVSVSGSAGEVTGKKPIELKAAEIDDPNQLSEIDDPNQLSKIPEKLNQLSVKDPNKKPDQSSVRVSVKEGETAFLKTGVENWENVKIKWKFGDENSTIVEIKEGSNLIAYDDVLNGRFKGRLVLDEKTGTLSINKTNTGDSGTYNVWVNGSNYKNTYLMFVVSVSAGSAGEVTGKKPIELKAENEASESTTVEMPLLSEEQQSSL